MYLNVWGLSLQDLKHSGQDLKVPPFMWFCKGGVRKKESETQDHLFLTAPLLEISDVDLHI